MAHYPRSAKNAKVRFGNTVVAVKSWEITEETEELDVTNSESAGCHEVQPGISKLTVNIQMDENLGGNLFDEGVTSGTFVADVKLYLLDTAGPYWSIPNFYVRSNQMRAEVRGLLSRTISGVASGMEWNYPTGNAVS